MSKIDFDNFINKQIKTQPDENSMDWDAQRDEWLTLLSAFYQKIEGYLAEYKHAGKLSIEYTEKDIFEDDIGSYSAKVLNIQLGNHKVKLDPIATMLMGSKGRVDLIGANGKIKFVLVNKNLPSPKTRVNLWIEGQDPSEEEDDEVQKIEWEWKIATPPPRVKYIALQQDTFLDALMEVVGG